MLRVRQLTYGREAVLFVLAIALYTISSNVQAYAATNPWSVPGVTYAQETVRSDESCKPTYISVADGTSTPFTTTDACVIPGPQLSVAFYRDESSNLAMAAKYYTDNLFRYVELSRPWLHKVDYVNGRLIMRNAMLPEHPGLAVVDNLATSLIPSWTNGLSQVMSYKINPAKVKGYLHQIRGGVSVERVSSITAHSISPNGRYVMVNDTDLGMVKIDLETGSETVVGDSLNVYSVSDGWILGPISDDGRYFYNRNNYLLDMDQCGDSLKDYDKIPGTRNTPLHNPCSGTSLYGQVPFITDEIHMQPWRILYDGFKFTHDDHGIEYFLAPIYSNDIRPTQKVTIKAPGYEPMPGDGVVVGSTTHTYLALGDSYSSGEGDLGKKTDGATYYLPGTDQQGGCHISSRSYPFLLQLAWGIAPSSMHSVACSGAQVLTDFYTTPTTYNGQDKQLLKFPEVEKVQKKYEALTNFIPGVVPQLEFVKKYQPSLATLTGGGNDVGFGDILEYCASPSWEGLFVNDTCGYAINQDMHDMLWDTIHTQYDYNKRLITLMRQASPTTRIVLVGYPSFIAGSNAQCALNSGALDDRERDMLNDAVAEMNVTLKKVADDTGITYVDTEKSLEGGRLCEGSEYMTGVSDKGLGSIVRGDIQELFHPNAMGHQKMADTIRSAIPDSLSLPTSTFISGPDTIPAHTTTLAYEAVEGGVTSLSQPTALSVASSTFSAGGSVGGSVASTPTNLGSFSADANGGLSASFNIPGSIGPGKHVLMLRGLSPSGDPLVLYQYLTVNSSDPNDKDGDGIPDDNDKCLFISHWYNETTSVDECAVKQEENEPTPKSNKPIISTPGLPLFTTDSNGDTKSLPLFASDATVGNNVFGSSNKVKAHTPQAQADDSVVLPQKTNGLQLLTAIAMVILSAFGVLWYKKTHHGK